MPGSAPTTRSGFACANSFSCCRLEKGILSFFDEAAEAEDEADEDDADDEEAFFCFFWEEGGEVPKVLGQCAIPTETLAPSVVM